MRLVNCIFIVLLYIFNQTPLCKALEASDNMSHHQDDINTSLFNKTWPEIDTKIQTAPIGLIDRLPPDGTWARFKQNGSYITIASVGKMIIAGQPYRWIEVILELGGEDLIWKVLISEKLPKTGRNILEQATSVWHRGLHQEPTNITGMSPADEFGELTFILTGPDKDIRPLEPQTIETMLGPLECSGWTGQQLTRFDQQEIESTFIKQWVHEKAPFGVVRSEIEYSIKYEGNIRQAKDSITLMEAGTGAHSRISTVNRSIEELTARPFAPSAGWRWVLPPENCNWRSMATLGLAMSIHRSDTEFLFIFAYPWVPGAAEYQAVAFDRNQRRYEFTGLPGGASGTVGLKIFTLLHEILPHDQVKYVGIEKQRQDMSKTPPSLVDKSLPSFANVLFNSVPERTDEIALLICLFDMNQRPSRNCIMQLSKRAQELKIKEVAVIAIHASKIEHEKLDEWTKKNDISFPVGMIKDDEEKTRFNWGVKSLPWLILTNKEHVITAEGLNLLELNAQLESK